MLRQCEAVADRLPVVLMVYANVIVSAGLEEYAKRAAGAGAAGIIVPDLPHDESDELRAACDAQGIALVPLVAPTSTAERIEAIGRDARGFVYTVSLTGHHGRARRRSRRTSRRRSSGCARRPRSRWRSASASPRPSTRRPSRTSPTA